MRVVTRALSMASIVSGRPGPVPGAGGNWAAAGGRRSSPRRRISANDFGKRKEPPLEDAIISSSFSPAGFCEKQIPRSARDDNELMSIPNFCSRPRSKAVYSDGTSEQSAGCTEPAKGHCRITLDQTRNAEMPRAISSKPHLRAAPVCQKSHPQPSMVRTAGSG